MGEVRSDGSVKRIPYDIPRDVLTRIDAMTDPERTRASVVRSLLRSALDWRTERADLRSALARCRANAGNPDIVRAICTETLAALGDKNV